MLQPNADAFFVVTAPGSQGPDDRDIVFLRLTGMADPTQPNASLDVQEGWPADDFGGWLDNISDDVLVSGRASTTLGGSGLSIRLWVIEHPERGLLVLTAEAFENVDVNFQLSLARTEAIIESLEFVDLG